MKITKLNKPIRFVKMHGLGNDFMIIDAREAEPQLNQNLIKTLSHRNLGVGFDQLAVMYKSKSSAAGCSLKFWNHDGSVSKTCGNASRCIADLIMKENNSVNSILETEDGFLICNKNDGGKISVNMGTPKLEWNEIPLAIECDTLHLPLEGDPVATNMGNPHCTFFIDDINSVNLVNLGKTFETHQLFPLNTNVQIAQILNDNTIRVKVWERGVGQTLASGSSSCAVAVSAFRRGLTGKKTRIILDGGQLEIFWSEDGVWMSGETQKVFEGRLSEEFLLQIERS